MTEDEFINWAGIHAERFAMPDNWVAGLTGWMPEFCRLFTAAELDKATFALMTSRTELKYLENHRHRIFTAVDEFRRQEAIAKRDEARRPCDYCQGNGWVSVPMPKQVFDPALGRERLALMLLPPRVDGDPKELSLTMSVSCHCQKGEDTTHQRAKANDPCMTFARYQQLYPNWQEVVEEREALKKARAKAAKEGDDGGKADPLSPQMQVVLTKILERQRKAEEAARNPPTVGADRG